MMKNIFVPSIFLIFWSICSFGQSIEGSLFDECCSHVENNIFQYKDSLQMNYEKVEPLSWDEHSNAQDDDIQRIPDKIFIVTTFLIAPIYAGEELLSKPAFFKTTIQFVYGMYVTGYNVTKPTLGEEITIIEGGFTSKDIIEMFENHESSEPTGLRFKSKDFLLTEYLEKNNVELISSYSMNTDKYLGRIIIRTYFGDSKDNLEMVIESILNPIEVYVYE